MVVSPRRRGDGGRASLTGVSRPERTITAFVTKFHGDRVPARDAPRVGDDPRGRDGVPDAVAPSGDGTQIWRGSGEGDFEVIDPDPSTGDVVATIKRSTMTGSRTSWSQADPASGS
jgi:hypothetical protein